MNTLLRNFFWIPAKTILSFLPYPIFRLIKLHAINALSYTGYSNSQNRMDKLIIKFFKFKKNGICMEVGGADGIDQSNSLYLERKFNWKTYLVEPVSEQFLLSKKFRKKSVIKQYAFISKKSFLTEKNIKIYKDALQSQIIPSIKSSENDSVFEVVPTNTLDNFFRENNIHGIDILILDVEGYEIEVLEGYGKNQTIIDYILVESKLEKFDQYAKSRGWSFVSSIGDDYLYCLKK